MRNIHIYFVLLWLMLTASVNTVFAKTNYPIYQDTEEVRECYKDLPYIWRGKSINKKGTYRDTVVKPYRPVMVYDAEEDNWVQVNEPEVDTLLIYTLKLDTFHYYLENKTIYLCDECSFTYNGRKYRTPGTYDDTLSVPGSCDSIMRFTIRRADGWHYFDTAHFCSGSTKTWRGQVLTEGGDYLDQYTTVSGQDSIYHLHLIGHNPVETFDTATICASEKYYWWMNNRRDHTGDYTVRLRTRYGCDSICHLNLTILPLPEPVKITKFFCQGEGILTHGMKVEKDTTFTDTITAVNGCDSIIISQYISRPSDLIEEVVQHFENETFIWRGMTITAPRDTIIQDTVPGGNQFGCDSIYRLRLITRCEVSREIVRCIGDTAKHGETIVSESMIFHDTLYTASGADSIVHTSYNFVAPFYSEEKITICSNQYVQWVGHLNPDAEITGYDENNEPIIPYPYIMLHEPGRYYDTHRLGSGCDSTYVIDVTVRPAYLHDTLVIWCNDSLAANGGWEYTTSKGTFVWHQPNVDTLIIDTLSHTMPEIIEYPIGGEGWEPIVGGCDSIEIIHLVVTDRCSELDRYPMCRDGSLVIDGKTYTQPGRYFNTMPSSLGLNMPDSTHSFEIYIVEPAETQTELVVCESELPYFWHGQWLTKNGDYETHLETIYHCDSLVKLHFIVIPPVFYDAEPIHYCTGRESEIRLPSGRVITPAGGEEEYNDTVSHRITYINLEGVERETFCDSIIRMHIIGHPSYFFNDTIVMRQNGTYNWHHNGQPITLTAPGIYWDSCLTVSGCDSIYRLNLIEAQDWYHKDTAYVCENELPHQWHGIDCYEAKVYVDHRTGYFNTDSVYEHELIIYPAYLIDTVVNICHDTKYTINGKEIPFTSGLNAFVYDDTLKTQITGCDSIYRYHINRFPKNIIDEGVQYVAEGQPFTWRGYTCVALGSYFDTIRSIVTGCDSIIYTFELRHDRPFLDVTKVSICQSEGYYEWRGRHLNQSCVLEDKYQTSYLQLDSIYRLELDIRPTYHLTETKFICPGEGVNFGGRYITVPGVYHDTAHTVLHSCDSIHTLILNAAPSYFIPEVISYVNDSELPILWHGRQLPGEGVYYDSLLTQGAHPCDSVHQVQVIKKQIYSFEITESICEGEYYEWFGVKRYETGTYIQPYKTVNGMDSIYTLHLTVNPVQVEHITQYLCDGQTYSFFGKELSEPAIYRDTLIDPITYCDHIYELVLNKYETAATVINDTLCEGDKLFIGNEEITRSGVYFETLAAISNGCDSTVKHIVTVGKPYYMEEARVINQGMSFTWHRNGQPLTLIQEGDYWDSCRTVLGCDSIMKLVLRFNKEAYNFPTFYDTICQSDLPYIWHTYPTPRAITQEGLYYDSCTTRQGADSVHSLHLTILPVTRGQETLHFCEGDQAQFNGLYYTGNAVVHDTVTNSKGCDSIVTYYLHFHPKYAISKTVKLTSGQSFKVDRSSIAQNDTIIRTEGIYSFRLKSEYGCDSTVTYIVDVCTAPKYVIIPYDMCQGDVLTVNGNRKITQSGDYDFFFRTADGCDSIVRYVVKVNPAYEFNASATMCKNSSYTWWGHKNDTVITRQGTYYDSLKTHLGCDSVYCLKLSYRRTDLLDTIVSVCSADLPYRYKGQLYYEDRVFYDTLSNNTEGCDSVLRWNYRVNTHCSEYVHYNRCVGHYMTIDGMVISQQGTYAQHHLTEAGLDSLYRFTVHDVPNYEFTTQIRGCDSVVYNGKTYYARGLGQETFTVDLDHRSVQGCDSLEHLELTIHMSSPTHVYSKTIADFDSVRFGPYYYNTTGSYPLRYTNVNGCDSIEVLNLTVLQTQYPDIVHYFICQGDPRGVDVFGKEIHPTNEYTFIADTIWIAGQPIIRTADIVVQQPFKVNQFLPNDDQIVCSAHELMFDVRYTTVDPQVLPDYYEVDFLMGDIEAHPLHQEGTIDGKNTIPISMNGQGKYVTPGYYRYYLKLRSESCTASDTTLIGSIMVRYPDNVMESSWNDAVMLVNEKYNGGGWAFRPPYLWQVLSSQGVDKTALVMNDATQPYLYSPALEEGDRISVTLYREGYDLPIPSCEYIFTPVLPVIEHPILIYPSAVPSRMPVMISSERGGTYRLIDQTGRTCYTGSFHSGETPVTMPGVKGCYFMVVEDEDGEHKTQKLIVY